MIISLAVFGREFFSLEIGRRYFDAEPAGSSVVLRTQGEFADDDQDDGENHAYEEHPVPYGFSPRSDR